MKFVYVAILAVAIGTAGFSDLIGKAKEAAQKCWDNPTCRQSVIDGASGLAKMFQKK